MTAPVGMAGPPAGGPTREHRHGRRRFAALAASALAALLIASCAGSQPPPPPQAGQTVDMTPTSAVEDATLTTTTGRTIRLADLAGKVVVVSDMMTLCQESCPLDTANVVAAASAVEKAGLGDKVVFLSVTIDPTRDTPAQLRAFRKLYAPAPADWMVAGGTAAQLGRFWAALGVYIQRTADTPPLPRNWRTGQPLTYDITHSDDVFFFGPHGHERFVLTGVPHVAAGAPIPATLKKFLDADGRQNLADPGPDPWTETEALQTISWLTNQRVRA